MKINIGKTELIHFVGIGGIGMSGLALIMNSLDLKYKEVIYLIIKILIY